MTKIFWLVVFSFLLFRFSPYETLVPTYKKLLSAEVAGMLSGLLWGEEAIAKVDRINFLHLGIVHVLVASGAQVWILVSGVLMTSWLVGRRWANLLALVVMVWYCWVLDFAAPVLRASLFLGLKIVASLLGRRFSWERALILVFVISWGRWDMSFVLSVVATIGLHSYQVISNKLKVKWVAQEVLKSLWVWAWVVPVLTMSYKEVNILPLVASLPLVMLTSLVVVLGFISSIFVLLFGNSFYFLVFGLGWIIEVVRVWANGLEYFFGKGVVINLPVYFWAVWYLVVLLIFLMCRNSVKK